MRYEEVEQKIDASEVVIEDFLGWMRSRPYDKYVCIDGYDTYYQRDGMVVRHRDSGGAGELTVKLRTSRESIVCRKEVDLRFAPDIQAEDVRQFVTAVGFQPHVRIYKKSHIFWVGPLTVVLYDCQGEAPVDGGSATVLKQYRIIEVEAEKDSDLDRRASVEAVESMVMEMRGADLPLGKLISESLYELFTGRRYKMAGASS